MVTNRNFILLCFALVFSSCTPQLLLKNGRTKVPKDFGALKAKYQKNKSFPLKDLYAISYEIKGKRDFKIDENFKPWYDNDSFKKYVKFYENGNVNFFYLQEINDYSFDPNYNGDRGFYYFIDNENFIIKIYVRTGEWGGKSYETYYGKIDGDKILLRTKHNYAGTNNFKIEVFKETDFRPKKKHNSNW